MEFVESDCSFAVGMSSWHSRSFDVFGITRVLVSDDVTTEMNTDHTVFTALWIAKKMVLMNFKNKNNLNSNQYGDHLTDRIYLEPLPPQ